MEAFRRWYLRIQLLSVLAIAGTCAPTAGADPIRIVAFGDSTTAPHRDVHEVYAQRLPAALAKEGIEAEVFNAGRWGGTTDAAKERFQKDVLDRQPHLAIIQFGLNDSAVDAHHGKTEPHVARKVYEANLEHFIATLKAAGCDVILMTPNPGVWTDAIRATLDTPPYDTNDPWGFNLFNALYAASVRRIAAARAVPLVDVYQLYLDYDKVDGQSAGDLLPDGIHPNDRGHRLVTELLVPEIAKLVHSMPPVLRGYTIPLLDLAGQTHRQTIVDREPGQYLGHPTTVLLEDHRTMIAVYPKGHGHGGIVMKRSTDAGRTWSKRLAVPENWSTSKEVPTIFRVVDRKGVKRLILFSGLYPIRMSVSEDDGITWSPLTPIGDFGGIVTMSCLARLANGDYVTMFHDDGRFIREGGKATRTFKLYQTFSKDGGLTWGKPEVLFTSDQVHLCEAGIIRCPDGKRLAILLRENSRTRNAHVMFSDDEAKTWSKPRELPGSLTGDRHTARYAPDGRLFVSFRDTTHESPTKGDWVGWVGTFDDIVKGREGQYRVRLMDNRHKWDCAYPGVEVLPDGTFITTTYGHWVKDEPPYIVSVRFTLEELDKMASTQPPKKGR